MNNPNRETNECTLLVCGEVVVAVMVVNTEDSGTDLSSSVVVVFAVQLGFGVLVTRRPVLFPLHILSAPATSTTLMSAINIIIIIN